MSKARSLRESVEVLIGAGSQKARLLRDSVEVLIGGGSQKARSLRESVEVLVGGGQQKARLNRISIEVLITTPRAYLCGKIIKVAGAAWRLIVANSRVRVPSSGDVIIGVAALLPGGIQPVVVLETPMTIAAGELESTGGVPFDDYKILPVGTLVSTYTIEDTGEDAEGLTSELHYRTKAVAQ